MKRTLFLICMSLYMIGAVAQEQKNEIAVSYGAPSYWSVKDGLISAGSFGLVESNLSYDGALSAQYYRYLSSSFALGGVLAYESADGKIADKEYKKQEYKDKETYFTMMPAAKLYWFNKKHFAMYSKVALGVTLWHMSLDKDGKVTDTSVEVAYQGTPIAIEAGGQTFRVFAELGFGVQGAFQLGLKKSF